MVKVRLERQLVDRSTRCATLAGYASIEEFIAHAVEKELSKLEAADSEDEMKKRLKGLGYIS